MITEKHHPPLTSHTRPAPRSRGLPRSARGRRPSEMDKAVQGTATCSDHTHLLTWNSYSKGCKNMLGFSKSPATTAFNHISQASLTFKIIIYSYFYFLQSHKRTIRGITIPTNHCPGNKRSRSAWKWGKESGIPSAQLRKGG